MKIAGTKTGWRQWGKPTPAALINYTDFYMAVSGVVITWLKSTELVGPKTNDAVQELLGLSISIILVFRRFVGVQVSGKTVPTENVTSMDTNTAKAILFLLVSSTLYLSL